LCERTSLYDGGRRDRLLHHVTIRVADVGDAVERWTTLFGLSVREADEERRPAAVHVRGLLPRAARSDGAPGIEHAAYELAPGVSLEDARGAAA
jgi:catechol 2,3-dioxygenase-like lactoylglutathione lyase family enzyme